MSVGTDLVEAARILLDDWHERRNTKGPDGIFTDLDVLFLASGRAGGYDAEQFDKAASEAPQVMGRLFRRRLAARFGPVQVPGIEEPDYMRIASRIVYASPTGPPKVKTPNGTFKRVMIENDVLFRQGRREGANRNDLVRWSQQDVIQPGELTEVRTPEQREIARLRAETMALQAKCNELEIENQRLRENSAKQLTRIDLEEVISSHLGRKRGRAA